MLRLLLIGLLLLPGLCSAQPERPEVMWTRLLGDTLNDWGMDIQPTIDGGFVCLLRGDSYLNPGRVIKLNADGETEWEHITRFDDYDIITYCIAALPDLTCVYVGLDNMYGTVTVGLDANGQVTWSENEAGTNSIYYRFITRCLEGGCAVLSDLSVEEGFKLIRYNGSGVRLWGRHLNCDPFWTPSGLQQTMDGGYAVLLCSNGSPSTTAIYRMNAFGDSLWTHVLDDCVYGYSFCKTSDGGFAVCGEHIIETVPVVLSGYIAKLNHVGVVEWIQDCPGTATATLITIEQAVDGGFIVAGYAILDPWRHEDMFVARTDANADTLWTWHAGGAAQDKLLQVRALRDGCIATGIATPLNPNRGNEGYVIRFGETIVPNASESVAQPSVLRLEQNYPNPFNATTEIRLLLPAAGRAELRVFNTLGQTLTTLLDDVCQAGVHTVVWDAKESTSGLYFYQLKADGFVVTKKMMLIK